MVSVDGDAHIEVGDGNGDANWFDDVDNTVVGLGDVESGVNRMVYVYHSASEMANIIDGIFRVDNIDGGFMVRE